MDAFVKLPTCLCSQSHSFNLPNNCFSPLLLHVRRTTSSLFCCIMKMANDLGRLDAKIKQSLFDFSILSLCYRRVKLINNNKKNVNSNKKLVQNLYQWEPICTSSPSVYPWKKFYLDKNKFIKDFSFSLGAVGFSDCCWLNIDQWKIFVSKDILSIQILLNCRVRCCFSCCKSIFCKK